MQASGQSYICCFGEVLWDLLPAGRQMGGAPMNVAAHLKQMGLSSLIISRVGRDELGNEIIAWLSRNQFPLNWVQTDMQYPTGRVSVDLTDKNRVAYEIVQPAAWDFIEVSAELISLVRNSLCIVYGSLACRNQVSGMSLLKLLEQAPYKIFDVNLRPPHYSQNLVEQLLQQADMVKMNDDELREISGWYGLTQRSDYQIMDYLRESFRLKVLLVTRGGNGAIVLNETGFCESPGFKVKVADTIGSGDAFLAGFLKMFASGKPVQEALNFACAAGALVATYPGAIPAVTEKEIMQLIGNAG